VWTSNGALAVRAAFGAIAASLAFGGIGFVTLKFWPCAVLVDSL
jgi:hypothetical protein